MQVVRAAAFAEENDAPEPGSSVVVGAATAAMSAVGAAGRAAPVPLRQAALLLGVVAQRPAQRDHALAVVRKPARPELPAALNAALDGAGGAT